MHHQWPNFQGPTPFNRGELFLELESYIFPLSFITSIGESLYINYLLDENGASLRYLHLEITKAQLRALAAGGLSIRSCIKHPHPTIYDEGEDGIVNSYGSIHWDMIPSKAIPEDEAYLTGLSSVVISKLFDFDTSGYQFVLSGGSIKKGSISFVQYHEFLKGLHELSVEVGHFLKSRTSDDSVSYEPEFHVSAQQAASFAIRVDGNQNVKIALSDMVKKYTPLFEKGTVEQIKKLIDTLPDKFVRKLFDYYDFSIQNLTEILIYNEGNCVYLGPSIANKIKVNVDECNHERVEPITLRGYLIGGHVSRGSFNFHDEVTDESYRGTFSEEYLNTHASVVLSEKTLCEAVMKCTIRFKFSKFSHSYELLSLTPLPGQSIL